MPLAFTKFAYEKAVLILLVSLCFHIVLVDAFINIPFRYIDAPSMSFILLDLSEIDLSLTIDYLEISLFHKPFKIKFGIHRWIIQDELLQLIFFGNFKHPV
jgi:hypothetical protein